MDFYDVLLAKKLGGSGGGGQYEVMGTVNLKTGDDTKIDPTFPMSLTIKIPESVTSLKNGNTQLIAGNLIKEIILPQNYTKIEEKALYNLTQLEKITLSNIYYFDTYCLANSGLKQLDLSYYTSQQKIFNNYCFSNSKSLERVIFPNDDNYQFANYCFNGCTKLNNVDLTEGCMYLGGNCFTNCSALDTVIVRRYKPDTVTKITKLRTNNVFSGNENLKIYVPADAVNVYKSDEYWSTYADKIFAIPS